MNRIGFSLAAMGLALLLLGGRAMTEHFVPQYKKGKHTIPKGVKMFYANGCTGLTELTVPEGVRWFDARGCTGLTELTVPEGVKWFYASGCTGLTELTIPEGVEWFYAKGCTGLTELTIPEGVKWFYAKGCTGILPIYVDDRGYELRHISGYFQAGCSTFPNAEDALSHWGSDNYPDPERGRKFCEAIKRAIGAE